MCVKHVFLVLYRPQADALHSELDVLSERYSQKCLELNRAEQRGGDRETELSWKDREMEQLRRENQVREQKERERDREQREREQRERREGERKRRERKKKQK